MKLTFSWKFSILKKVKNFNTENVDDVTAIDGYPAEITKLDQNITNINVADTELGKDYKGETEAVQTKKAEMAETIIMYAHLALPLARNAGKTEYMKQLKHEVSWIMQASKTQSLANARIIRNMLAGSDGFFTNITPAMVTIMDAKITAYDSLTEKPKILREYKKIKGTKTLESEFKKADIVTKNMYDMVYGTFKITKPFMVETLADILGIDKDGVRHTGIVALCEEATPVAGAPNNFIENVLMKVVELDKSAVSDIDGMCGIAKMKPGTYHVEFSKTGYATQQMILVIKRRKMLEVEVKMVRV